MANKLYSMEDVKKNCENNQTWVVINNSIYNVTEFLNEVREYVISFVVSNNFVVSFENIFLYAYSHYHKITSNFQICFVFEG